MRPMRLVGVALALPAVAAAACSDQRATGATANVVLASAVGVARYSAGDCGDEPDASAAECLRGPQPQTDEGRVHLPTERADAGLDANAATDPDAAPEGAPSAEAARSPQAPTRGAVGPPRCRPPAGSLRRLRSWVDARVRGQYEVVLTHTSEWVPVGRIDMPLHHATRLELQDVEAYPALVQTAEPVRAQIELTQRDIRHDTQRGLWLVTWHARVLDACVAPRQ